MRVGMASFEQVADPLHAVEAAAEALQWACLREAGSELLLAAPLEGLDVQLTVQWLAEEGLLQISATWDMRVPAARRRTVAELVQLVNPHLPLGHFELWEDTGTVIFRHAQMIGDGQAPDEEQARGLLQRVAAACGRYHPAFQFVLWAGKSPREALRACMFDTVGEA